MTHAPASLLDLNALWEQMGGDGVGIIGNQRHCAGYHLGKDRIYGECACRPDGTCEPGLKGSDYSVKHPRDAAGLSNAASAIDLGRLDGSLGLLQAFSRWLVARCQANREAYRDIREVIYSPDGKHVQRYSGVDNEIHTGDGNGDLSHLSHTHISFYRDSEYRDKTAMFAPYFQTGTGETMSIYAQQPVKGTFTTVKGDPIRAWKPVASGWEVARTWTPSGNYAGTFDARLVRLSGTAVPSSLVHVSSGTLDGYYVSTANLVNEADTPEPADPSPYTQADIDAAIAADRAKARVTWE